MILTTYRIISTNALQMNTFVEQKLLNLDTQKKQQYPLRKTGKCNYGLTATIARIQDKTTNEQLSIGSQK